MKILKEASYDRRIQEAEQAVVVADDKYRATSKELANFKWSLVDRGFLKYNPDPTTGDSWEQKMELTSEDRQKLKDLEAKKMAAWKDFVASSNNARKTEKEIEKARRANEILKYGVTPSDAQKFERLKSDISEAKRNKDYYERMFNQAKEDLEKAIAEMKSLAPDWAPNRT